jgi:hypothetical protein
MAALTAIVAVGTVIAAGREAPPDLDALDAAVERGTMLRAAEIPATDRLAARGVYLQLTSTGHFCLWDAPSAGSRQRQGGCNPADDPLGGRPLSISLGYDGGPSARTVTDARLIGVAMTEVARVDVQMSDGTRRRVALKETRAGGAEYRAFGYRIRPSDLRTGVGPVAVLAFDSGGREIDRQPTGFAG